MRIAIHFKDGSVAAYKLGRIQDGVHNVVNQFTGETVPLESMVEEACAQAENDFRGDSNFDHVSVERLVMKSDTEDESEWIPVEDFDPEIHTLTRAGNAVAAPPLMAPVQTNIEAS